MKFATGTTWQAAAELRQALDRVEALGLTWIGTRFAEYLSVLETTPAGVRTFSVVSDEERADERLRWEAANQAFQLCAASWAWASLDEAVLRSKLKLVLNGAALPPVGGEEDTPRNTLFELTTAGLLHDHGFSVELTRDLEDIRLVLPGYGPLALECKRPAHAASLDRNLRKVRKQIRRRLSSDVRGGFAAIGVERIERATEEFLSAQSYEHLARILLALGTKLAGRMRSYGQPTRTFWPDIPIGAAIFCGVVFLRETSSRIQVAHACLFSTTSDERAAEEIEAVFQAEMKTYPFVEY